LNIIFIGAISWWFWKSDDSGIRKFYWPAWGVKLLAGIALGIVYSTYYSSSDTFFFFDAAVHKSSTLSFSAYVDFVLSSQEGYFQGEARTVFFIKIVSLAALISNNNYWITSLYFSFLSFFSAWWLAKTIARYFPEYALAGVLALLFFPSVVFWSSGIIKESLAMAGLFCVAAFFLNVWMDNKFSLVHIFISIISIILVWNLKYYYVGLFVPVLVAAWLARKVVGERTFLAQMAVWIGLLLCMCLFAGFIHPNFSVGKILLVIVSNNEALMAASTPEDVIHYYNLQPTWFSVAVNSPWALFSGLFRHVFKRDLLANHHLGHAR
jgi:hypothetical protein